MIRPTARGLLLAGSLLLTPVLAFAQQPEWLEEARKDAAGAALFIIAIAVPAMITVMIYGVFRQKRRHDLFARFIDKGQEIPLALLPARPSRHRDLRRGVWLAGLGIGVGLVLYIATGNLRVAAWCLILLLLGAASFVNAALFHPKPDGRE
jgi:hypothetical protein